MKLFEQQISGDVINVSEYGDGVLIKTTDNQIAITYKHFQDCCENVYLDTNPLLQIKNAMPSDVSNFVVVGVPEFGVLFNFGAYYRSLNVFCSGWDYQNGYYSSQLDLIIEIDGVKHEIDISLFTAKDGY